MARLDNNFVVINIEWCSDETIETETLINMNDRPVMIGDTYKNEKFYRNGVEILTPFEELLIKNIELEAQQNELITSYSEGVNSI